MEIFEETIQEKTKEEELSELNLKLREDMRRTILHFDIAQKRTFNEIWFNKKFTPQEIIDSFGTDAMDVFVASDEAEKFKDKVITNYEYLKVPNEFTINADKTVTIGDKVFN